MSLKVKFFTVLFVAIFLLGISPVSATVNLGVEVFTCNFDNVCSAGETNASCASDCSCGNGTVEVGEACDLGAGNGACPSVCSNSCQTQCDGGGHSLNISNIVISNVTDVSAQLSWNTDYEAICKVSTGLTNQYNATSSLEIAATKNHNTSFVGLTASTTYYYKIHCDEYGYPNQADSGDKYFVTSSTAADIIAPQNVKDLIAVAGNQHILLSWINPLDLDFTGVVIRRSTSSIPALTDGVEVYNGYGEVLDTKVSFDDTGLVNDVLYYYTVFAYDSSMPRNYASGVGIQAMPFLVTTTPQNVKDLRIVPSDQQLSLYWTEPDDIDYAGVYIRRSLTSNPTFTSGELVFTGRGEAAGAEYSFVNLGLINNTLYHYTVFAFRNSGARASGVSISGTPFVVENATTTPTSTPPYGTTTPPYGTRDLYFRDFDFFQTEQQLIVGSDDVVNVLTEQETIVRLAAAKVLPATNKLVLNLSVNGQIVSYPFQFTTATGDYTLSIPGLADTGKYWVTILVFDANGQNIKTLYGWIQTKQVIIVEPPIVIVSIIEEISKPIQAILRPVQQILKPLQQVAETPAAQAGVAVTVAIAAANIIVAVPWWNWWYLLQFIFTQPFQLFFRRKGWGVVYNSITKKPVDLALVRLYDSKTNRLISSKVTDQQGRYIFLVDAGEYYLSVEKPEFEFPSKLLQGIHDDGSFVDLYYGGSITVNTGEKVAIVANIPLDPTDLKISNAEIIRRFSRRRNARYFSWLGPIIAVVYLIIVPSWLALAVVVGHLLLLIYFRRTAQKLSGKKWGIVYDAATKKPLGKSITRIFSPEYGRMLEFYVTDNQGRYGFLAGGNKYYVMADKEGYQTAQTPIIDLTHSKGNAVLIAKDLGLNKTVPASTSQSESLNIVEAEDSATDQELSSVAENKKEE